MRAPDRLRLRIEGSRARTWRKPTDHAANHCKNCKATWTRPGKEGGKLTICALDRELVLADMTNCDYPKGGA